jgi:concanavalin A-like lectin/glucanase superfamily protein/Ig-like domain-containing protein
MADCGTRFFASRHFISIFCAMVLLVRSSTSACAQSPCASTSVFNVTGGGTYYAGSAGVAVGLDGSQLAVNYQLQLSGSNTGSAVAGTGNVLSFGYQTVTGTYTVVATTVSTGCKTNMRGSAIVAVTLQPGPAQSSTTNGIFTLKNNFLAVSWAATNGTLLPLQFVNNLSTQSWSQVGANLFGLAYTSTIGAGTTSSLIASGCQLISGPQLQPSQPNNRSTRVGDQLPGQELVASFFDPSSGIQVDWRAALRDGANYVRQFLTIHGTNNNEVIDTIELLDYVTAATSSQIGTVSGSPVVAGQAFFGGETPFAANTLTNNHVLISVPTALPLGPNSIYNFSAVAGVFPFGQLRRSFIYYLERERAAPYKQLLQFNSWLDVLYDVSETEMLGAISACELELHQQRGVAMDSYAMDDGWYDPSLGFWAIDTNKFPHQFNLLQSNVTAVSAHLGLWISPLGGYAPRQQELVQDAINQGIITSNLDLSIPTYYTWWTNECATFILSNAINYFKWDNAGNGVTPHFMALLMSADALRGYSSNLFINVTVGTWPSPFWLNHVDSIWRGGADSSSNGVGNAREQWITYRDGQVWQNVVQPAPLFPLTSLMLGGLIQAFNDSVISPPGTDLSHDARSFFGSGVNLQELDLTPSMLTSDSWTHIAESAAWARTNANVLVDSHWIGGNPNNLEVYGWAAWTPQKGTVVLRNPSSVTNSISFDIGVAFELPANASTNYSLSPSYTDQRPTITQALAGQPVFITLLPFEVLVFDALPMPIMPQSPTVTLQLPPTVRYSGATATLAAAAQGTPPISYHWNFNGAPIAFATNSTLLLSNLNSTVAGNYSVTVSNAYGMTNSAIISLALQTPEPFGAMILTNHPVAWWRLDEAIGPTIVDGWDSHNGTALGNCTFGVPGALATDTNTAIYFDGSPGTEITVPYAPELNSTNFSVECWARVTGGDGTYRSPLSSRDENPTRGYICYANSNDQWEFWTGTSSSWDIITGPSIVDFQWVYLACTYNGSTKSFYVNGQLVGTTQSTYLPNTEQPLLIGAGTALGGGAFYFPGDIDEVAIYDYVMSAAQIQSHFLSSPCISTFNFNVLGGGVYCPQGTGRPVTLNGSQSSVIYQLQLNGSNIGVPVAGTGSAISFGDQTATGTYTIVANVAGTGCTTNMNGSVTINIATWPTTFNVTGGGTYTQGSNGVPIGLDGSQPGINYQLQLFGGNVSAPVGGTGSAISFGDQTLAGTYTVAATINGLGCPTNMNGTATITVIPLPSFLAWQLRYFGCTNCPQAASAADPDGDGQNNFAEFLAGTDPTNRTSSFHITGILRTNNNLLVSWITSIGKTDALQAATAISGSYPTNFADIFTVTNTVGSATNYLDIGAVTNRPVRYYRVRLVQ